MQRYLHAPLPLRSTGMAALQREGLKEVEELGFEFRRQRFVYNEADHMFEKLKYPTKASVSLLLPLLDVQWACSSRGIEMSG